MIIQGGVKVSGKAAHPFRHERASLPTPDRRACCGPLVVTVGLPILEEEPRALQELATLPASVDPTSVLGCPCPMPCSDFGYPAMAMCLSRPQAAVICCHCAIEPPCLFSMDGKYDAGPCFGQGGACSAMVTCSPVGSTVIIRAGRTDLIAVAIDRCCGLRGRAAS